MQIKNYKLAILALLLIVLFCSLGKWQLNRREQKKVLLASFQERTLKTPLNNETTDFKKDLRFYPTHLEGQFDNEHTLLLDNKVYDGKVGYEVYTPFKTTNNLYILVDRGFVPLGASREVLPAIQPIIGIKKINGIFNTPPGYVKWGKMVEEASVTWPLRIEYLDLGELKRDGLLPSAVANVIVMLEPKDTDYAIRWQLINMTPEKHLGYAIQWFALAFTLLILFVALNVRYH